MDKIKKILKELVPYIIIIIVVVIIRSYIITPVRVEGSSMNPTLNNNDILILKKYDKSYKRFDIVVLNYNGEKLIKRIIGLPGETVEYKNNKLYINGKPVKQTFKTNTDTSDFSLDELFGNETKIPKDSYFVMGDNRNHSTDSRIIGFVKKQDIKGTIGIALFPLNKIFKKY